MVMVSRNNEESKKRKMYSNPRVNEAFGDGKHV
jgi:hypothetical protein